LRHLRNPEYAGVTPTLNDAKTTGDVLSWGMGTEGQRYSPLDKINTKNVKNLVPAWSFPSVAKSSAARNRSR
jgi:alcohol dehydrogenase (cytochrome c)